MASATQASLLTLALAGLGLGLADDAQAQQSPYTLGASLGLTHVSNIYRTADGEPTNDDNVTTASLLAGLDQRIGRQHLFGNATVRRSTYQDNRSLDNTGYTASAGLDWATVNRLSGQFSLNSARSLADFTQTSTSTSRARNMLQTDQARATLSYGLASLLSLDSSLTYQRQDYSTYNRTDYHQSTLSAGISYSPRSALKLGLATRYGQGEYPEHKALSDGSYGPDKYTRRDVDLSAVWTPSGASTVNARLSHSKLEYDDSSLRGYSGLTGVLNWNWQASGKLGFSTLLMRDRGSDTSFYSLGSGDTVSSDYSRVTNLLRVNSNYQLTGKILLTGSASYTRRDLSNTSSSSSAVEGTDKTTSLGAGLQWEATRSVTVGCQITHDKRSSDELTLSLPYSANSYGCYGQIMLR